MGEAKKKKAYSPGFVSLLTRENSLRAHVWALLDFRGSGRSSHSTAQFPEQRKQDKQADLRHKKPASQVGIGPGLLQPGPFAFLLLPKEFLHTSCPNQPSSSVL